MASMGPIIFDDAITDHMEAARDCIKAWKKPVLVMWGDR